MTKDGQKCGFLMFTKFRQGEGKIRDVFLRFFHIFRHTLDWKVWVWAGWGVVFGEAVFF